MKPLVQENHKLIGRRVFNTHLLPSMLPGRRFDGKTKYIYLLRSGPDACLSFFHHLSNQDDESGGTSSTFPNFPAFAQQWLDGKIPYGSWNHHVCEWLEAQETLGGDLLLLRYEDMVNDLASQVQRIALFLGMQILNSADLEKLLPKLTFSGMKKEVDLYSPVSVKWKEGYSFIRKGVVGDSAEKWSALAPEMHQQFDAEALATEAQLHAKHYELFRSLLPAPRHVKKM